MIKKKHSKIWLYFIVVVFGTVIGSYIIGTLLWSLLYNYGIIMISPGHKFPLFVFLIISIIIGSMISLFVGKLIIKPIQNISLAFGELSRGNFSVRVPDNQKIQEINEMAKCFNSMVYDLSHIETMRNDFVVNVSHEFKTPIVSIEGYATLLQDADLSLEKRSRYIEKILVNSHRLTNLTSNILMLSKLENQETVFNKKEYCLDEQIRRAVLLLEYKWSEKNIELDIRLPKCLYYGNEPLLDQVWFNLIDNAIKYSADGGKIAIALVSDSSQVSVSISDNGCGMSREIQKHVFEKFYQGDSSRKSDGNGLGLALVKRIVNLCSGEIYIDSKEGKGSRFTVVLPFEVK